MLIVVVLDFRIMQQAVFHLLIIKFNIHFNRLCCITHDVMNHNYTSIKMENALDNASFNELFYLVLYISRPDNLTIFIVFDICYFCKIIVY
jgi:hypothetical protein